MRTQTKEIQQNLTPKIAQSILVEGNKRFISNLKTHRNLLDQVAVTSAGEFPFAIILSCIDSRVPAELVFDQGIGDIFSARVAANIINQDVLGSMEYACKVAGSKIIVVMGHTKCESIMAACKNELMGNNKHLIDVIGESVKEIKISTNVLTDSEIEEVSEQNVKLSIKKIKEQSSILREMEEKKEIEIIGAMYDVCSGEVKFYENN